MFESILTVLLFVPLFLIVLLANLADKQRLNERSGKTIAGLTYAFHTFIFGTMAAAGGVLHAVAIGIRTNEELRQSVLDIAAGGGSGDVTDFLPVLDRLDALGMGIWLPAVAAPLFLLPPVRRLLADVTPIDALSSVHAVAASFVMLVVMNLAVTLAVGLDTLADMSEASETDGGSLLVSLWVQQITFALWAVVGVGWLTRRRWMQALERLGLLTPRPVEVAVGIGTGLLSVAIILALEIVAEAAGWGLDEDVQRLTEVLIGPLLGSIPGILTLGLAAGIGEETLFRGALQPRFGLLITSILFALLHSQYGITLSTLAVFIVGMILGLVRNRYNTSTCVIAHASYNITLGMIAYLFPQMF
ncbi:MAG: CPBP family intramembrane metalloprotease [Caldilineaceae bacterium SB0668_bin_21]|nr:CPBP family intramembrane metalloprotease [Caldilineaceae bacterium SB0668_bin_21]MYC23670.1 CPBP family intramembrane metalloprotease [Caldilineaceae bacterium SB0662_bin_25]